MIHLSRLFRCLALVAGLAALSGSVNAACSSPAGGAGDVRYATNYNMMAFCDGTDWRAMGASGGGGGASALSALSDVSVAGASIGKILSYNGTQWVVSDSAAGTLAGLTDTNITNLAGRDYLRYDMGTSKWVNISESTVMSTTTIEPGWPDAIRCSGASGSMRLRNVITDTSNGKVYYRYGDAATHQVVFNPDGSADATAGTYVTDCASKSISQLYVEGKAFNFIGNANTVDGALGDRITSGTLAMVANSATSYVSLSTAGTTWGYFNSGNSYLPRLTAPSVSGTYVQLTSPSTNIACTNAISGTMRNSSGTIQVCNGTSWGSLAGAAVLASLTDVQITNIAGRDYLRYDNVAGKWVNISESTVMSTTTMVNGWPDAIQCSDGSVNAILYKAAVSGANNYYVEPFGSPTTYYIIFNGSGAYASQGTRDYTDCKTSIAAISAAGRAFNFIGNANTSGGALGDRITSGTMAMVANSDTSYVSLSTAGTTWGYLGNAGSFLPAVTANKVSSTNVSATYLQLSSPTTVLSCNAGLTGSMRYTSGTMQVCDGSNWGNIGIGVPTGTIAAFATASCPSGWTEYTPARGRFLRGIDPTGTNDSVRAAGNTQTDAFQGHRHGILEGSNLAWIGNGTGNGNYAAGTNMKGVGIGDPNTDGTNGVPRTADETRPKNVAVTYCVYSGFQSAPGQTILTTLASLTDVSVAGASNGQVLTYSGGTWIASNTTGGGGATPAGGAGDIQFNNGSALAADSGQLYWDATNNRLGVGTSAPLTSLEVNGSFLVSASTTPTGAPSLYINSAGLVGIGRVPASDAGVYINSATTTGASVFGLRTNLSIEPTTAPAASQAYRGQYTYAAYNSAQTAVNGTIRGGEFYSYKTGTGSVSATYGVMAYSSARGGGGLSTSVWGLYGFANVSESASTGYAYGTAGLTYDYTGAGSGGGITNAYSFFAAGSSAAGNIANYFGLYVSSFGGVDPAGQFYGVYVADPAMSNYFAGKTGVGVLSPIAKLDVNGTISASDAIQVGSSSIACGSPIGGAIRYNSGNLQFCNGSSWSTLGASSAAGSTGDIQFNAAGGFSSDTGWLHWDATNNRLGIGTATPSYPLDVYGQVFATGFVQSSDNRLKKNISQISSGLAVISQLKPVTFAWKKDGKHAAGLIAQDVKSAIPSAVTSNTEGMYAVDYIQTIPYLVRGMQELKAANDNLTAENADLSTENQKLTRDMKMLVDRIDHLEQRVNGIR